MEIDSFNFSTEQKLSIITFFSFVINLERTDKTKYYENVFINQSSYLSINKSVFMRFVETASKNNLNNVKEVLKTLNSGQKDFFISLAIEYLTCRGTPTQREYSVFENTFEKIANIDRNDLSNRILKIKALSDKFNF